MFVVEVAEIRGQDGLYVEYIENKGSNLLKRGAFIVKKSEQAMLIDIGDTVTTSTLSIKWTANTRNKIASKSKKSYINVSIPLISICLDHPNREIDMKKAGIF